MRWYEIYQVRYLNTLPPMCEFLAHYATVALTLLKLLLGYLRGLPWVSKGLFDPTCVFCVCKKNKENSLLRC